MNILSSFLDALGSHAVCKGGAEQTYDTNNGGARPDRSLRLKCLATDDDASRIMVDFLLFLQGE
jgi:hypothetical protein